QGAPTVAATVGPERVVPHPPDRSALTWYSPRPAPVRGPWSGSARCSGAHDAAEFLRRGGRGHGVVLSGGDVAGRGDGRFRAAPGAVRCGEEEPSAAADRFRPAGCGGPHARAPGPRRTDAAAGTGRILRRGREQRASRRRNRSPDLGD